MRFRGLLRSQVACRLRAKWSRQRRVGRWVRPSGSRNDGERETTDGGSSWSTPARRVSTMGLSPCGSAPRRSRRSASRSPRRWRLACPHRSTRRRTTGGPCSSRCRGSSLGMRTRRPRAWSRGCRGRAGRLCCVGCRPGPDDAFLVSHVGHVGFAIAPPFTDRRTLAIFDPLQLRRIAPGLQSALAAAACDPPPGGPHVVAATLGFLAAQPWPASGYPDPTTEHVEAETQRRYQQFLARDPYVRPEENNVPGG